jgi:hypothetical protein
VEAGFGGGVETGASDGFAPDAGVPDAAFFGSTLRELSLAGSDLAESFLPGAEGLLGDFVTWSFQCEARENAEQT